MLAGVLIATPGHAASKKLPIRSRRRPAPLSLPLRPCHLTELPAQRAFGQLAGIVPNIKPGFIGEPMIDLCDKVRILVGMAHEYVEVAFINGKRHWLIQDNVHADSNDAARAH